ncbi:MAG: hypothetical protein LDL39_11415 [Magnetospirillum sp.]|nr:hypothetical protein [Magnetospirillum sp.]
MAKAHLKAKRVILAVVGIMVAGAAYAEYPTIDMTAIKELGKQLQEMKKQYQAELDQLQELKQSVAFLDDISGFMDEVKKATGAVGAISLPIPNLEKITAQTKSNMRCLMPDTSMKWGIKTEDLNLGSICETSDKYRKALFADPEQMKGMTFAEQERLRIKSRLNRGALLEDAATRGLAQTDVMLKQADELNNSADQLQSDLKGAKDLQNREHVQAQIAVAQLRGQAAQLQVLAQLLKVNSALAIAVGVPADKVAEITKEGADQ